MERRKSHLPPEEVLFGQHAERAGTYSGRDSHWPLKIRSLPKADPQDDGRQVLVLSELGQHDPFTRPQTGSLRPKWNVVVMDS
jgi:hypothetical protein